MSDIADSPVIPTSPADRAAIDAHMKSKWTLPEPALEDLNAPANKPAETPPEKPAVKEEPKVEAKVEPAKTGDEPKWPRNAKEWDAYKTAEKQRTTDAQKQADQYKADLESARKDIEALRKSGPSPELDEAKKTLESMKKERDDVLERIRIIDVEKDPRFQRYFNGKTEAQIKLASAIVGEGQAEAVKKVLALPEGEFRDSKIEEMMATLTPLQANRLGGVLNSMAQINQERVQALDDAKLNYDSIQAKTKAEQEAAVTQRKTEATGKFDALLSEAQKESPFFQKKDGDEVWNKEVEQRTGIAKALMFENKPLEQVAKAALYAAAFPASLRQIQTLTAENEKLAKQVASLTAATPKLNGDKPGAEPASAGKPQVKVGMNPMDAAEQWTKQTNAGWQ